MVIKSGPNIIHARQALSPSPSVHWKEGEITVLQQSKGRWGRGSRQQNGGGLMEGRNKRTKERRESRQAGWLDEWFPLKSTSA